MQNASSKVLIEACLSQNEDAWKEFLKRFGNLIYSTIRKVDLPQDDCEEAFQSSVVAIHRQLPRLRDTDRLISWIIGISYRQAVNRIRAKQRDSSVETITDEVLSSSSLPEAPNEMPDDQRIRIEQTEQVRTAFGGLTERCRRLLETLFFEDPTPDYAEISKRENIPIGSIGPTRARCLDRLRGELEDHGWSPE